MHVPVINKNEAINLKDSNKRNREGRVRGKEREGKIMYLYYNFKT